MGPWHSDNFGIPGLPKSLVNEEAKTKVCMFRKLAVILVKNPDACQRVKEHGKGKAARKF